MRSTREGWLAVALVGFPVAGCLTGKVDLGGSDGGGAETGTPATSYSNTIAVQGCDGNPANDPAFLGQGLTAILPGECAASAGPAHAAASIAEMTQLVVGTWFACDNSVFGIQLHPDPSPRGIELTADGRYTALGQADDVSLVPLDAPLLDAGPGPGPSDPNALGTWTVADGSATYGPGTYELQLRPGGGGLYRGQVSVTDSPLQMHFSAVNSAGITFAPPAPWSPRKGVCTCLNATGTKVSPNDPVGLQQAMTGRWLWCGSDNPPGPGAGVTLGMEFPGDGTWYALEESASGQLSRGAGSQDHGTMQVAPTSALGGLYVGPEPLVISLGTGNPQAGVTVTQVVVTENPRALLLQMGTRSNPNPEAGIDPGPNGPALPIYSVLFPMP